MIFEETKVVTFTPDQMVLHAKALAMYSTRMQRNLESTERKLREATRRGEYGTAMKLNSEKKDRLKFIAEVEQELYRFKDITGV